MPMVSCQSRYMVIARACLFNVIEERILNLQILQRHSYHAWFGVILLLFSVLQDLLNTPDKLT